MGIPDAPAIAGGAAAAAVAVATSGLRALRERRRTVARLRALDPGLPAGRRPRAWGWRALWERWQRTEAAAALRLRLEEYWGLVGLAAVVGAAVGALLRGPAGAVMLGGLCGTGVVVWFRARRAAWLRRAETQLPDLLRGVATAMRAGASFHQALATVGQDLADPLGAEVRRLVRREALGYTLDEVLEELARRVPSRDLELAIVAIQIQREVGGALAPLLESITETVLARQRLKAEVRTLTATGRASGLVLTLLPIGLGMLIEFVNPSYMAPLWTTGLGHAMLGYGVVSLAVGGAVIRKLVQGPEL
ncbi:MAG: type II secretion system F family protein [Actinomycetia bacterium]|nr:type II secretion system F family protein [Actinomycetes bacterium]